MNSVSCSVFPNGNIPAGSVDNIFEQIMGILKRDFNLIKFS